MSTFVYLAYAADDDLLYVGHTRNLTKRMACHRATAEWPTLVARIDIEEHDTAEEARQWERIYIADLEPAHNILGNPRYHPEPYEVSA